MLLELLTHADACIPHNTLIPAIGTLPAQLAHLTENPAASRRVFDGIPDEIQFDLF